MILKKWPRIYGEGRRQLLHMRAQVSLLGMNTVLTSHKMRGILENPESRALLTSGE